MFDSMLSLLRRRRQDALDRPADPNPGVAFAVGLLYVFRTAAGARILRELEGAVRKYEADPQALWRLLREGEDREVIDGTVAEPKELPPE
jgi:hypothetical protein